MVMGGLFQLLTVFILRKNLSPNLELTNSVRLTDMQVLGICPSLSNPSAMMLYRYMPGFYRSAGQWSSCSYAYIASALSMGLPSKPHRPEFPE